MSICFDKDLSLLTNRIVLILNRIFWKSEAKLRPVLVVVARILNAGVHVNPRGGADALEETEFMLTNMRFQHTVIIFLVV